MSSNATRRLAAILFADIAGYTALMQRNEGEALEKLARFKQSLEAGTKKYHGTIIQYYGDGCLILFDSPAEAVAFAEALQRSFLQSDKQDDGKDAVPVRIGIHLGDVVFREGNVFGDSVNIASRVESLGVPGAVLLSETVRSQIKNKPEFQLVSLGSFEFKNVEEPMEVFALANEGFPIPKREEMEGKLKSPVEGGTKNFLKWKVAGFVILGLLLAVAGWSILTGKTTFGKSSVAEEEKSIAVLPFRNLSSDPGQDYFAEGVVEAIHTKLAQIENLRVTSMTSVLGYRQNPKTIPEIAKELKVKHILEGSVMKDRDKVRIVVKLMDASDRQLWTYTDDRNLSDIFAIQSSIAQEVVTVLETKLSPGEKGRLAKLAVTDISAYDLYLSGLNDSREYVSTGDTVFNESALRKFRKAVQMDADFDEANALLADSWYARRKYGFGDRSLDSANYYAGRALEINPSNGQALVRKGWIAWDQADFGESKKYAELALKMTPNNSQAMRLLANYYMAESETVEKAVPLLIEAIALDPQNQDGLEGNMALYQHLGNIYLQADMLKEAEAFYEKALELSSGKNSLEAITWLGYISHIKGDFAKSIEYRRKRLEITPDDFGAINEYAGAHYAAGNFEEAEKYYRKLFAMIEQGFNETYESFIFRHRLAHILWLTNRKQEAKKLFDEHLENEMADLAGSTRHFGQEYAIAGAYAAMGEKEKAYEWLEKMPFWFITYQYIQIDPLFDSLRGEDRFNRILIPHREKIMRLQASLKRLESEGQLRIELPG